MQPASAYYDKQFRAPIDLGDPGLWRLFAYHPAARIYHQPASPPLSLHELGASIVSEYEVMGLRVQGPMFPDAQTVVIGFVTISNSSALLNGLFLEGDLGFTGIPLTKSRVFVFDTHNNVPDALVKLKLRQEAERSTLSLLLDSGTRVTSVSLDNTDIGRRASPLPHIARSFDRGRRSGSHRLLLRMQRCRGLYAELAAGCSNP